MHHQNKEWFVMQMLAYLMLNMCELIKLMLFLGAGNDKKRPTTCMLIKQNFLLKLK
jgi:hypothetical protein